MYFGNDTYNVSHSFYNIIETDTPPYPYTYTYIHLFHKSLHYNLIIYFIMRL